MKSKRKVMKCPYCGHTAVLRDASYVYGEKAIEEHLYVCSRYPECNAYVGVHKGTLIPKGTLANGDLRHKRIEAHKAFSKLWDEGIMSKKQAYHWLGYLRPVFRLEYRCDELIRACKKVLLNNRIAC